MGELQILRKALDIMRESGHPFASIVSVTREKEEWVVELQSLAGRYLLRLDGKGELIELREK